MPKSALCHCPLSGISGMLARMRLQMLALAALIASQLLLATPALSATPTVDYCEHQLSPQLLVRLNEVYPGYRAPRSADNLDEDISINLKNGGTGCLGIARSDVTGSGEKSLVVALTASRGDGYIVVVAPQSGSSWDIFELLRDSAGRQRLYIDATPAGHYDHVADYEPDASKGELASLDCPHPGVVIGATEATGDVYCIVRGKWQHLPISD